MPRGFAQSKSGGVEVAGRVRALPHPGYRSRPRLRVAGRPRPSNRSGRRDAARTRRRGRLRYRELGPPDARSATSRRRLRRSIATVLANRNLNSISRNGLGKGMEAKE